MADASAPSDTTIPGSTAGADLRAGAASSSLIEEISSYLQAQEPSIGGTGNGGGGGRGGAVRVLLPYSGTTASEAAIDALIRLAAVLPVEARLLHVREFDVCRGLRMYAWPGEVARRSIEDALSRLHRRGVNASGLLLPALRRQVARTIADEAGRSGASYILLGMRPRRSVTELLVHTTGRQLLRMAPCPVIVVRAERKRADPSPGEADPGHGHQTRPAA